MLKGPFIFKKQLDRRRLAISSLCSLAASRGTADTPVAKTLLCKSKSTAWCFVFIFFTAHVLSPERHMSTSPLFPLG